MAPGARHGGPAHKRLPVNIFARNVVANLAGTGWAALVQLAAVPALISLLGVASFALVGFNASLVATLAVLDLGLSASLTRRMASAQSSGANRARASDSLRTYERVFWITGAALGALLALGAPLIARAWLTSSSLAADQIEAAVRFMGLLLALRWPMAPYIATLQGLQRQISINAVNAVGISITYGAGVAIVAWLVPSVAAFFAWHCACAAAQVAALRVLAFRALRPESASGRFSTATLLEGWRFALGMTVITLTGALLAQGDKLLLSKLVPLEEFGRYSVALVAAGAMYMVMLPVFSAALPRLCERVTAGDESGLRREFSLSSSVMHALLVPMGAFLILFPDEVLRIWTHDADLAARAAPLLALLAAGAVLNGFMNVPYALQMARGNTAIGVGINIVLCVLLVPGMLSLTNRYGVLGGALVSPILNALYLMLALPRTLRECLGGGGWLRFYGALFTQQVPTVLLLLAIRWWISPDLSTLPLSIVLAATLLAALLLSLICTEDARNSLLGLKLRSIERSGE
jgi:O-antigen/teichoic acid export membrane protein